MRLQITMIAVCLTLTACSGFGGDGLRLDPLPHDVATACDRPETFLAAGDWEIIAGRIGDALIDCGDEKMIAVGAYGAARAALE